MKTKTSILLVVCFEYEYVLYCIVQLVQQTLYPMYYNSRIFIWYGTKNVHDWLFISFVLLLECTKYIADDDGHVDDYDLDNVEWSWVKYGSY